MQMVVLSPEHCYSLKNLLSHSKGSGGGVRQDHLQERKRTKLGGVEETDAPRIVVVVMATVTSDC